MEISWEYRSNISCKPQRIQHWQEIEQSHIIWIREPWFYWNCIICWEKTVEKIDWQQINIDYLNPKLLMFTCNNNNDICTYIFYLVVSFKDVPVAKMMNMFTTTRNLWCVHSFEMNYIYIPYHIVQIQFWIPQWKTQFTKKKGSWHILEEAEETVK